jgi:fructuronate reductase
MMRLTTLDQVPARLRPGYDPASHGIGIVHLGLGAFHKAHQAALTDLALAASGGNWRILGVSLRSERAVAEIAPQNGLYTLIERGPEGSHGRVVGSIAGALCSAGDPRQVLQAMAHPTCRIVSLTVTEKAYGLDRERQECDPANPAVAADLANPDWPQGVLGLLTKALTMRRAAGLKPFTVLCCDNLPENGTLLRGAVLAFAGRIDPRLAEWISVEAAFPSCMVDRITPAPTVETRKEAEQLLGASDLAAVETEPFVQWVIEDYFPLGRPDWDLAGAVFVTDVSPYERMKLRMLNGTHSLLAYAGFHAGHAFVRDAMRDAAIAGLVQRHLAAAAETLPSLAGIDLGIYARDLVARFSNPAIAHATFQIAMDGSEKMPQRIFAAVADARDLSTFAFATAAWLRHVSGSTHDCAPYELRDPRAAQLRDAFSVKDPAEAFDAVSAIVPIPAALRAPTLPLLTAMLSRPMASVIAESSLA